MSSSNNMPSKKNRNKSKGRVTAAAPMFSLDAAISEAKEAKHRAVADAVNVNSSSMSINDENARPNEMKTIPYEDLVDGFLPLGKPRRSFIGTKTPSFPGPVAAAAAAAAETAVAVAAAATDAPTVESSDDEVEDINGVDAADGNSLESLSPYSSTSRPASAGKQAGPPPSEMKYSTILSGAPLYNLMGGHSDVVTPRTLELSNVLESLSFDFSSPSKKIVDEVSKGELTPEDSMPFAKDNLSSSSLENVCVMVTTAATTTTETFDVAQTIYGAIKETWANGKHIPVISNLFDVTETVAAKLLDHLTSTSGGVGTKEMVLLDIDERVVKPHMKILDEKIVSPTILEVLKVIEFVVRKADEMVMKPIASGPLGTLFFNENNKHVEANLIE